MQRTNSRIYRAYVSVTTFLARVVNVLSMLALIYSTVMFLIKVYEGYFISSAYYLLAIVVFIFMNVKSGRT